MHDQLHDFTLHASGGTRLARIEGFGADGHPMVSGEGLDTAPARSLVALHRGMAGREVAVTPLAGAPGNWLILGVVQPPAPAALVIEAETELTLRCGKSSVTLTADGRVTVAGRNLLSRAEGQNRVQGAVVSLN